MNEPESSDAVAVEVPDEKIVHGRLGDIADFPEQYTTGVSGEDQARLVAAFPELRILYNHKIGKFQCVHRQPGWRQAFYVGTGLALIVGWSIIPGNYDPPLKIDDVILQLRIRVSECEAALARTGRGTITEAAEKMADEFIAKVNAQVDRDFDEALGLRLDGTVSPFGLASDATISRAYKTPKGPGAKELARSERRRLDRLLRQGVTS